MGPSGSTRRNKFILELFIFDENDKETYIEILKFLFCWYFTIRNDHNIFEAYVAFESNIYEKNFWEMYITVDKFLNKHSEY